MLSFVIIYYRVSLAMTLDAASSGLIELKTTEYLLAWAPQR